MHLCANQLGISYNLFYCLWYLALDITANCICEIHCLVLDGFDLNTVHKLSSKEEKSWRSWDSNTGLGLLGGKLGLFHCAMQAPPAPLLSAPNHKRCAVKCFFITSTLKNKN